MEVAYYVYLACLAFGVIFALLTALLGGIFGAAFGGGHDVHVGGVDVTPVDIHTDPHAGITADSVGLSPTSPIVLCFFIGVFGGTGMICLELLHTPLMLSVLISTLVATLSSTGFFYALSTLMIKVQGSMSLSPTTIIGGAAQVSTAIPEHGMGEITYVANGMVQRASARSEDGRPIPQSAQVMVTQFMGNCYIVRRAA